MTPRTCWLACLCLLMVFESTSCTTQRSSSDVPVGLAQWILQPDTIVGDGNNFASYQVRVVRATGGPWQGARLAVDASDAHVWIEQPQLADDRGTAAATVRCAQSGVFTLSARVLDGDLWRPLAGTANLICQSPSAAPHAPMVTVTACHDVAAADMNAPVPLILTVTDAQGRPLPDQPVSLTPSRVGDQVVPATAVTDALGQVQAVLISGTLGTATVIVHAGGATSSATVHFVAGAPDLRTSTFVARPGSKVADGQSSQILDLTIRDPAGHPVPFAAVTFSSDHATDRLTPKSALTTQNGQLSVAVAGTQAGARQITAATHAGILTAQAVLVAGPPSALTSSITLNPNALPADGVSTAVVTVLTADAVANPVANQPVTLSASGTGIALGALWGSSDANGLWTTTVKTTTAQTTVVTATASGLSLSGSVVFVAGSPNATLSSMTAAPTALMADGLTTTTLTVTAKDAWGNAVPNVTAVFSGGSMTTFAPTSAQTDGAGTAQTEVKSPVAQMATLSADLGTAVVTAPVTFMATPPDQAHCSLTINPNSVTADGTSSSTVTAVINDALGNPCPGLTVIFAADGSDNTWTPTSATTDSSGLASATLSSTRAEPKALTASTNGVTLSGNILFVAGSPNLAMSTLSITPLIRVADGSQTITASAQINDAYANPVPNLATSVTVTGTSTNVTPSSGTTDAAGYFASAVSTWVVQSQNITLIAGPLTTSASANFTVGPASAAASSFVASPSTNLASDGSTVSTMTLTLRDRFSRAIPSQTVKFSAVGWPDALTSLSSVTDGLGMAQTALTSRVAGAIVVVANSDSIALTTNAQFNAKPPFCSTQLTLGQRPFAMDYVDWIGRIDAADLNQDGNMDLIFTLANSSGISVYWGQGYGQTDGGITYPNPASTNNVAIADFDHDNYLDIAQSVSSDSIVILRGQADYSMSPAGTVSIGTSVTGAGVCTGDIDKDGNMDLVSVYNNPSGLAILLGDGAGGFTLSATYPVNNWVSRCAIADFDADGIEDIAVTTYGNSSVDVYYGEANGTFTAAQSFWVGSNAYSLEVGHFDQDALVDIAVVNSDDSGTLSVLLGASGRSFQPVVSYPAGSNPFEPKLIDINGDGNDDIVVNNEKGGITYLLGLGDGTFGPASYASAPGDTARVTVADFDNDGALDVIYSLSNNNHGGITYGLSPGVLPTTSGTIGGSLGAMVTRYPAIADFNKDGNMDIIGVGENTPAIVVLGQGDGQFAPPSPIAGTSADGGIYVATGDINGDGNTDAVIMNISSPSISVLINTGDGNFTINTIDGPLNSWDSAIVADVNGDGLDDILVTAVDNNVYQYITTSTLGDAFSSSTIDTTSYPCEVARVVDINNDGLMDLVVGCSDLVTMIGDGTGTYSNITRTSTQDYYGAYRLDTADFDGDGYVDAVTFDGQMISIFRNQQDNTFAKTATLMSSDASWYGNAVDINGDGFVDIVIATTGNLNVFLGTGTGSFGSVQVYPGPSFFGIAVGDLDHNGKPDIVTASQTDGLITYMSSGCTPN